MNNSMIRRLAGQVSFVALVVAAPSVLAQQAPTASQMVRQAAQNQPQNQQVAAAPVVTLDPIITTATKTPQRADEQPFSVDVVGQEELERKQPVNLEDILRDLPGVSTDGGSRSSAQTPNIRGFGGQRVVTTIDGARQNFDAGHKGGVFIEPDMLKQVEVLKGAGSALYGSGAIGGVMALTTKDAADFLNQGETFGARLRFGYSSAFKEPLATVAAYARPVEQLDLVAYGAFRDSGDIRAGSGGRYSSVPYSAENQKSGLFKATVRPNDHHKLQASVQMVNLSGTEPINTSAMTVLRSELADRMVQRRTYTASYGYDNPDQPLINPNVVVYRNAINVNERRLSDNRRDVTDLTTTGIDAKNTARFSTGSWFRHAVTFGVEYFRDEQDGSRNNGNRDEFPDAKSNTTGVYLQDEIRIGGHFSLVPGVRYDSFKRDPSTNVQALNESKTSPRIGASFDVTDWAQLYGSYGQAFRAPAMTELYVAGTHFPGNRFIPNPNLKPETATTAEGGLRFKFDDVVTGGDALRAQIGYFNTDAKDFIDFVVTATTSTYRNVSRANVDGWEGSIRYDAPRWFASIAGSAIRGKNKTTNGPIDSMPADKLVPTVGAKLHEWDVVAGVSADFVAAQDRVTTASLRTPGYGTGNVFVAWVPSQEWARGLRVDAAVNNVFDRYYRNNLATTPEPGRDFRLSVAYALNF